MEHRNYELRRNSRVNGDKRQREAIYSNGPEDMGKNSGGVEQTDKDRAKNSSRKFKVERIGVAKTENEQ